MACGGFEAMPNDPDPDAHRKKQDGDLHEVLEELRVALPGVQMLFAFQLTVPFAARFERVSDPQRAVFFASLVLTAVSSLLLIAPSVYHRLHWRRAVADKEAMLQVFNRLAIAGSVFLAAAVSTSVYFITRFLFDGAVAAVTTAAVGGLCVVLWYVLPLYRCAREAQAGRASGSV